MPSPGPSRSEISTDEEIAGGERFNLDGAAAADDNINTTTTATSTTTTTNNKNTKPTGRSSSFNTTRRTPAYGPSDALDAADAAAGQAEGSPAAALVSAAAAAAAAGADLVADDDRIVALASKTPSTLGGGVRAGKSRGGQAAVPGKRGHGKGGGMLMSCMSEHLVLVSLVHLLSSYDEKMTPRVSSKFREPSLTQELS